MWIFLAFAAAIFAGITAILAKIGIRDTDSNMATAIRTVVILGFTWLMVFIVGSQNTITQINNRTLLFLVLSGLATGGSWLCYFKALQLGDVNKVTPIDKSSTVLTIILSFIFLGETVTIFKLIGMIAIGVGTLMMITKKNISPEQAHHEKGWMLFAVLSAVFAALTAILGKVGIDGVESNLGTAIRTVVVLIMAWMIVIGSGKIGELRRIDKKSWLFLCLSGITTGLSWLCFYGALKQGEPSIVVSIDKHSIVLTIAFSYLFLKEKLRLKSFAGLCLVVIGTLTLLIRA
ncbi:MAG: EamA family transporter [Candidatus ainarchaeum sp.]|nr:EamA family transporter [Candidatus ainarchaeum sp.]